MEVSDLYRFLQKAQEMDVLRAGVLAVSEKQRQLEIKEAQVWAESQGLVLAYHEGWTEFVRQALFWSEGDLPGTLRRAIDRIFERSKELEVSGEGPLCQHD